jgi:hypothetical protein
MAGKSPAEGEAGAVMIITTTNLVDIDFDIDRYLDDGGRIVNLRIPDEAQTLKWYDTVPVEVAKARLERVGRYLSAIGEMFPADDYVGDHLSGNDLLKLWRKTSEAA